MQRDGKDKKQIKKDPLTPKKLDIKTRKRNRAIALVILGLIIGLLFVKCSDDTPKVVQVEQNISNESNSSTKEEGNGTKEKNSTLNTQDENDEFNTTSDTFFVTSKEFAENKLLEDYRKKRTYSKALALANFYFSQNNYNAASSWAIVANRIDQEKKRAWYIYIKSKISLKEYKKASEAIRAYLKMYKSPQLEELLKVLQMKLQGE